jgi:DNA-binding protein H-NS
MADKVKPAQARIDATHMGDSSLRDDETVKPPTPVEKDEDWGAPANEVDDDDDLNDDDDLDDDEELEVSNPVSVTKPEPEKTVTTATATATAPATNATPVANAPLGDDYFSLLKRAEQLKEQAVTTLTAERDQHVAAIKEIDEKLAQLGIKSQESEAEVLQRTDGRRRRQKVDDAGNPVPAGTAAPASGEVVVGRRTRPKNEKTLKEAIVDLLTKDGRLSLKSIAQKVVENGFKTNSQKFSNTVRVQLYRLEDDKEILAYQDGTFGMNPATAKK